MSKIVLGLSVALVSGAIVLAYTGMAEPSLTPSQVPGNPAYGFAAIVGLVVGGAFLANYLDLRAWRRMGNRAGLSPEGRFEFFSNPPGGKFQLVDNPDLTGTVRGRPVRVRVAWVGGGRNESSRPNTVVETELDTPVDWNATFVSDPEGSTAKMPGIGSQQWTTVDGFAVLGEVPEDVAGEVLSDGVREALTTLGSNVSVGDVGGNLLDGMVETLSEDSGSMAAGLAGGLPSAGSGSRPDGESTSVSHRERGLLLDGDELERRAEAVAAVAESVERTATRQ